jgi:4-diphosphocytidyl-2-C-methyl-D-erythritol kinase
MVDSLFTQAPAKLNLALSVGAPRADGMHPICSWMVTVDLFDDLYLERLPAGSFSLFATVWHRDALRRREIDWSISKDLVNRAHDQLERFVGRELPIKVRVEKRIPIGGGLGGGSSDAAAMLRALNALFELHVKDEDLRMLAAHIGSDVPFLVSGGSALVGGTGGDVRLLGDPPDVHAVLFFPEVACPTADVYRQFDRCTTAPMVRTAEVESLSVRSTIGPTDPFNDLAGPARDIAPSMADDMEEIGIVTELPVQVCGSGSSLFVICADEMHAQALASHCATKLALPAVAVRTCANPALCSGESTRRSL